MGQEGTDKATYTSQAKVKPGHQYESPANYPVPDMLDSPPRTARRSHPSTKPSTSACIRKRSKLIKPECRKIQRRTVPAITTVPRVMVAPSPVTRRQRLTPSQLAMIVSRRSKKRPAAIVGEVAERYGLNPEQKKVTVSQVIAMRAIQRRLSAEIRCHLPIRQTATSVGEFMDRLADKLEANSHQQIQLWHGRY